MQHLEHRWAAAAALGADCSPPRQAVAVEETTAGVSEEVEAEAGAEAEAVEEQLVGATGDDDGAEEAAQDAQWGEVAAAAASRAGSEAGGSEPSLDLAAERHPRNQGVVLRSRDVNGALAAARVGLGRIVALYHRASTL
jgi:hypothetical protein